MQKSQRNFGLDIIRSTAIVLVVISHASYILSPITEPVFITAIRILGAIGVDLFFVLSGFLIGKIILKLIENEQISFAHLFNFWKRRWLRTLPNYFLILLINIILAFYFADSLPKNISQYFIFTQNFNQPHPDFFTEAWSLSIEEYAYLFLPLILFLCFSFFKKINKSQLFIWTAIISIFILGLIKLNYFITADISTYKLWSLQFRKVVIYRIDAIYFGFVLIYFYKKNNPFFIKHKLKISIFGFIIFLALHIAILAFQLLPQKQLWFYVFVYLQSVIISLGLMFPYIISITSKGYTKKFIEFISKRSYAIYLINYSIVYLSIQRFVNINELSFYQKIILILFFLLITLLLSEILYRYFENPILKFRNRKFPK